MMARVGHRSDQDCVRDVDRVQRSSDSPHIRSLTVERDVGVIWVERLQPGKRIGDVILRHPDSPPQRNLVRAVIAWITLGGWSAVASITPTSSRRMPAWSAPIYMTRLPSRYVRIAIRMACSMSASEIPCFRAEAWICTLTTLHCRGG